jgi:hypothetical protein
VGRVEDRGENATLDENKKLYIYIYIYIYMGRFRNQSVSGSNPVAERRKINGRFQVLT